MYADVDNLKVEFADSRYKNLLQEWYMVKTSPIRKENNDIDNFLLIALLESNNVNCNCCLEDIKLL